MVSLATQSTYYGGRYLRQVSYTHTIHSILLLLYSPLYVLRYIRFWNAATGKCLSAVQTQSQISSLLWNQEYKELVSGHGFANNEISVWKYPNMNKLAELHGHTDRVLNLALSPNETAVASIAADQTLCIWNLFPHRDSKTAAESKSKASSPSASFGKLRSIR